MADEALTLHGLVEAAYHKHADRQAVIYDSGEHQSAISYRQMWGIAYQVKKLFTGREKEVVGLCLHIDHRMPAILLGVLGSKAVFYNFDVKGFAYAMLVLKDVGAQVVLIHQNFIQVVEEHVDKEESIFSRTTAPELEDYFLVQFTSVVRKKHEPNLAYCITTSGTTGKPKVVMVPDECIVPNIIHLRKLFTLMADDLVLAATALTFDPSIVEIFMALSVGACLLIVPPLLKMMPERLLEMVFERNKVTVIQVTPTLLSRFNASKLCQTILGDNSVMRVIALGGEKFPSCSWLQSMKSPSNRTRFYNLYGTTEVSCWATCHTVTEDDLRGSEDIPLGKPLLDTIVEVRDDAGRPMTEGEGKLWIGGRRRQCLTDVSEGLDLDKLVLRDTGDDVRLDQGGRLYYIGRRDQQRKRNGQRINLAEIKTLARRNMYVHDCEVSLIGDQLIMFIVPSQQTADAEVVSVYMKVNLPSHWWPDSVKVIENLPVTIHGKVDLKALENIYNEGLVDPGSVDAEEFLLSLWKDLTNRSTVVPETENFILAGGDSLKAVKLANTVENVFSVKLPQLVDIVLHKTYNDVRKYFITVLDERFGQMMIRNEKSECSLKDKGKVNDQSKTDEMIQDVGHLESGDNTNYSRSECDKLTGSVLRKRKLSEGQRGSELTNDDIQCSIRRGNRLEYIDSKQAAFCNESVKKMRQSPLSRHTSMLEVLPDICLEEMWKYNTGKCVDASPLLVVKSSGDYLVMIGSHSHRFSAIRGSTGERQWETTLPDRIESSASLSACANFVIVGCYDGSVYCLHVNNGEIWWQFDTGSQVKCSPVVDTETGLVYIGSHSQSVYCLNVKAQGVVWERNCQSGSIFSSPTISREPHQLYVATLGGKMFALDPVSGEVLWEYNFQKPVFSSPAPTQTGVCVGCTDGFLYNFSFNGKLLWKCSAGGHIFSSPSVYKCSPLATSKMSSPLATSKMSSPLATSKMSVEVPCVTKHYIEAGSNNLPFDCNDDHSGDCNDDHSGDCNDDHSGDCNDDHTDDCNDDQTDDRNDDQTDDRNDDHSDDCTDDCRTADSFSKSEYIIFGSHDKHVYCVSNEGKLVWKLHVNSEMYSSPFQCVVSCNNYIRCTSLCEISGKILDNKNSEGSDTPNVKDTLKHLEVDFKHDRHKNIPGTSCCCNGLCMLRKQSHQTPEKLRSELSKCKTVNQSVLCNNDISQSVAIDSEFSLSSASNRVFNQVIANNNDINQAIANNNDINQAIANNNDINQAIAVDNGINRRASIKIDSNQPVSSDSFSKSCDSDLEQSPSIAALHFVVFASTVGTLYIVHVPTGKVLYQKHLDGEIFSSPVVYNNNVIVGCRNDFVYCFKIS